MDCPFRDRQKYIAKLKSKVNRMTTIANNNKVLIVFLKSIVVS